MWLEVDLLFYVCKCNLVIITTQQSNLNLLILNMHQPSWWQLDVLVDTIALRLCILASSAAVDTYQQSALVSLHVVYNTSSYSPLSLPLHISPSMSLNSLECSSFSPPATVILLILLCFEGLLFLIFTSVMFGTQVHSICTDETVSDPFSDRQSFYFLFV